MNIQIDHIHLIVSVQPKISISHLMRILKGKTAINLQKLSLVEKEAILGQSFWDRGDCIYTIGLDEDKIKK